MLLEQICNPKSESVTEQKNIAYIESVENFTVKNDETGGGLIECEYIDLKTDDCTSEDYFKNELDNDEELSKDDYDTSNKESKSNDKSRKVEKKVVVRQTKKKTRKKSPIRKSSDFGNEFGTDLVNQNNQNGETKSNVKIPENYMTGKMN